MITAKQAAKYVLFNQLEEAAKKGQSELRVTLSNLLQCNQMEIESDLRGVGFMVTSVTDFVNGMYVPSLTVNWK